MAGKLTKEKVKPTHVCNRCGNTVKSEFYTSYSVMNKFSGKMSVCKKCVLELYDEYYNLCLNEKIALYNLCRLLDVYFSPDVFKSSQEEAKTKASNALRFYFKNIFSLRQYRDKTFDESLLEEQEKKIEEDVKDNVRKFVYSADGENLEFEVTNEIIQFWGN